MPILIPVNEPGPLETAMELEFGGAEFWGEGCTNPNLNPNPDPISNPIPLTP